MSILVDESTDDRLISPTIAMDDHWIAWEVIHGNGGLQAALDLGWTHVAANIVDVDDATAKAIAKRINRYTFHSANNNDETHTSSVSASDAQLRLLHA